MSRPQRIIGSFTAVLASYWAYLLLAVPLIEPSVERKEFDSPSASVAQTDEMLRDLAELFPPGAWQLQEPATLQNGQVLLLFQRYKSTPDGRLTLNRCTLVYSPPGPSADRAEALRRKVILDAPEGAELQFDKPIDLGRGQVGKLVAGRLIGSVVIRSAGRSVGPEDDLWVGSQNVYFNERQIWSTSVVEFRYGPNHGRGREMYVTLDEPPPSTESAEKQKGMALGDLESVELRHVDRLHLEPAKGQAPAKGLPAGVAGSLGQQDGPVEISCQGPFRLDLPERKASFSEQVVVLRTQLAGQSDQLRCETLNICLAERRELAAARAKEKAEKKAADKPAPAAKKLGLLDFEPQRIEATGDAEPVAIHAPNQRMQGRSRKLTYDIWTGKITLEGRDDVWLQHDANEIHAAPLQYEPSADGRLGRIEAGPGWLRGRSAQRPDAPLEARWSRALKMQPQEQNQVVSLVGDVELRSPETGQLNAEEVHAWLIEQPPAAGQASPRFQPDRMMALRNVRLQSAQLTAKVEHLEVWLLQPGAPAKTDVGWVDGRQSEPLVGEPHQEFREDGGARSARPTLLPVPLSRQNLLPTVLRVNYEEVAVASSPAVAAAPALSRQQFEVLGKRLRAQMVLRNQQAEVVELVVEENVRITETQTTQPGEKPVVIVGDKIVAIRPNDPSGTISVLGKAARFEGRGLTLSGQNLNVNRGANLMTVEGPGSMTMPLTNMPDMLGGSPLGGRAAPAARPPAGEPAMLDIRWHRGMRFDGRIAVFENQVTAIAPQRHIDTEVLEVQFKQPIQFSQQTAQRQPTELQSVSCRGGVYMEAATLEGTECTATQTAQMVDFSLNLLTGATAAAGPGQIVYISRKSPNSPGGPAAGFLPGGMRMPGDNRRGAAADNDGLLSGLTVRFQGPVTGNIQLREATFRDRVKVAYGPAPTWQTVLDPDRPEALGPRGLTVNCDLLSLVDMPTPTEDRWTMEMTALENVVVESQEYTARASRLAYSQAKDLMILEGDGRTDAQIFRHAQGGMGQNAETKAQRIEYRPSTNQVIGSGFRGMETR